MICQEILILLTWSEEKDCLTQGSLVLQLSDTIPEFYKEMQQNKEIKNKIYV